MSNHAEVNKEQDSWHADTGEAKHMNLIATQAAEKQLLLQTYDRHPILLKRGEGVYLFDDAGNRYLDLLSGIGVSALGYGHPAILNAIQTQAATLLHTSNLFYHDGTATLAVKLAEITGMDRVFFCNSGTEAWEAALKLARAHAGLLRAQGKSLGQRFIAMEHSFHGRTMGSVATTHKEKYREPFAPVMPDVIFVPFNDVDALRAAFSHDVCGICLEPLQGEGGIHPVSEEFFGAARELCNSTGALLLADEIQSGMGRTGKWCAYQHYGIQPDITTLAKPLAGGLPMGAMLCTDEAARAMQPGMHGTTFGGGPLACAVALAVIHEIERSNLLEHVTETGEYFIEQLRSLASEYPALVEVRGSGFMIGVEVRSAEMAKEIAECMMFERHILLNRTSETVLRFLPPYLITTTHIDETIAALSSVLEKAAAAQAVPVGEEVHG